MSSVLLVPWGCFAEGSLLNRARIGVHLYDVLELGGQRSGWNVRFGSKTDLAVVNGCVGFVPEEDIARPILTLLSLDRERLGHILKGSSAYS